MALEFPKIFGNYALKGLEEIASPDPISTLPSGPGWWFVFGAVLLLCAAMLYRARKRWRANAYRRRAITALAALEKPERHPGQNWHDHLKSVPEILRATALHAYPRLAVVAASGDTWREFLNAATDKPLWSEKTFQVLYAISYKPASASEISTQEAESVLRAAKAWVNEHTPQPRVDENKRQGRRSCV
ncbi:MAG: hypothetical protein ACJAVO_000048 [Parvibaculaceae bacterium]|jgi:hypothetical protein